MKKRYVAFILVVLLGFSLLLPNQMIVNNSLHKTFDAVETIPKNKVGVVLGTARLLKSGRINLFFQYRIDATVALYKAGKIRYVLVSGDNGTKEYDEPTDFKNELVARGIPVTKIFLDYAGFRTLDSVVRAKKVFGQSSITFISQKFHNERAIYIAEQHGMKAVGFNAKDIEGRYGLKTHLREYLARTKVFLDLLFGVQPKFLGTSVIIK